MSVTSGNLESPPIYNTNNIRTLTPLEAIQVRPAMYLGDVGPEGLHKFLEILLTRALAQQPTSRLHMSIDIQEDNSVVIIDNTAKSLLDWQTELSDYKQAIKPYGLSLAVINALAAFVEITIYTKNQAYQLLYKKGQLVSPLLPIDSSQEVIKVKVYFKPDDTLFVETVFDVQKIAKRLWELTYLNQGACFVLKYKDKQTGKDRQQEFHANRGVVDFIPILNDHSSLLLSNTFGLNQTEVKVAFNYQASCTENVVSFVNNNLTSWGGTHLTGFRRALTFSLKSFAKSRKILEAKKLSGKDFKKGIVGLVSVNLENARFDGATKVKLWNPEVAGIVYTKTFEALQLFWQKYPELAKTIIEKAIKDYNKPLRKKNRRI